MQQNRPDESAEEAPQYPLRPIYAAGIVERHDNRVLIVLPPSIEDKSRLWQFPRGRARENESPEAALRRTIRKDIGVAVEIVVGQPPLIAEIDGEEVELRYFFCGVARGGAKPGPYGELRWVTRAHLREYEFDEPSAPVVEWLIECRE